MDWKIFAFKKFDEVMTPSYLILILIEITIKKDILWYKSQPVSKPTRFKWKLQGQKKQTKQHHYNTWKRTLPHPPPTVCNYHVLAAAVHGYALNGPMLWHDVPSLSLESRAPRRGGALEWRTRGLMSAVGEGGRDEKAAREGETVIPVKNTCESRARRSARSLRCSSRN